MDFFEARKNNRTFSLIVRLGALSCFVTAGLLLGSSLVGATTGDAASVMAPPTHTITMALG